jgi:hypothetical protein
MSPTATLSSFPLAAVLAAALTACGGSNSSPTPPAPEAFSYSFPATAEVSELAPAGANAELALPGLGGDFRFGPGSTYVEAPGGRVYLLAVLQRRSDPAQQLELRLGLRRRAAHSAPPRVRLGFGEQAYVEEGGPIDPSTWSFYELETGALFGLDGLAGLRAALEPVDGCPLQSGVGADNRCTELGASTLLRARVESQPQAATLEDAAQFELTFARQPLARAFSIAPPGHAGLDVDPRPALTLPGLGGEFEFVAGGEAVERADGTIALRGVIADRDDPARRFALELSAQGRIDAIAEQLPPAGSPQVDLPGGALRPFGPADPGAWRYWSELQGSLRGLGALRGAELTLRSGSFAPQLGLGASGADLGPGLAASLAIEVRAQPLDAPALSWSQPEGSLRVALRSTAYGCADEPRPDPEFALGDETGLWIPGLAQDLVVVAGGEFREDADGGALLIAELASLSSPSQRYLAEIEFGGRVDPFDAAHPPQGSPQRTLLPGAYVEGGGPADARAWHYYTECAGTLRGLGSHAGALLAISRFDAAFQVGLGANGASLSYGGSGGLLFDVLAQPASGSAIPETLQAGLLRLELEQGCVECPTAAIVDPSVGSGTSHAVWLPGIATDFVFVPGATFVESPDGSARLTGVVRRKYYANKRFRLDIGFSGRIDPGQDGFPPAGSPKLELDAEAYLQNGGPIDPGAWHYYTSTEGRLYGEDYWAGGELRVWRHGPSFQVGLGANGKNLNSGASGWLNVELVQQSTEHSLAPDGTGDINVDVGACP